MRFGGERGGCARYHYYNTHPCLTAARIGGMQMQTRKQLQEIKEQQHSYADHKKKTPDARPPDPSQPVCEATSM